MIVKLDEKVDIKKLNEYLSFVIQNFPPNMKDNGPWGGWSITSSTGEIHDGWQTGEKINDPAIDREEKQRLKRIFEKNTFTIPTPLYTGYFKEVLKLIHQADKNLVLSRIRIAVLKPHNESEAYWHTDGDKTINEREFRLHIPIRTNELCFFDYENERHHLEADGSIYLIEVSKKHRAVNLSSENRYHLIMDVSYRKY